MNITIREDLKEQGLAIPDVDTERWYSQEDLENCKVESVCEVTGNVTAKLADGSTAKLYSIDLDYSGT
jgi:hypothetical protein